MDPDDRQPSSVRWTLRLEDATAIDAAVKAGKLDAKKPIDADVLIAAGVLRRSRDGVRLLAKGEIKSKVELVVAGASKAAIAAVEKAGGKVTVTRPAAEEAAAE